MTEWTVHASILYDWQGRNYILSIHSILSAKLVNITITILHSDELITHELKSLTWWCGDLVMSVRPPGWWRVMFTLVFSIRLRLGVQWVSLLRHHNVLIMMIYYSGYYNIVSTRNASQQGKERIFLLWWHTSVISSSSGGGGGGAERRILLLWWHTSVSCPVSICPARKKLNWFLQGNKAKRRSPPLFQI